METCGDKNQNAMTKVSKKFEVIYTFTRTAIIDADNISDAINKADADLPKGANKNPEVYPIKSRDQYRAAKHKIANEFY